MNFYGVLGEKLPHTISPEIHGKIFSLMNIEGAYKKFEVEKEDLFKVCDSLKVLKIKGINVTIPYKQEIMKYLDFISDEAKKIGAVNTVCLKDDKLYGYNTDYFGFGTIIEKNNVSLKDKITMVLGTGGASKAVVTYLLDNGVKEVYVVSRSEKNLSDYSEDRVKYIVYEEAKKIKGHIIVNTTPVGMYPHIDETPVKEEVIENFDVLIDIIYNPSKTKFLEIGCSLNKKICGGLDMLIGQAIKAEEVWQEIEIPNHISDKVTSYIKEVTKL